MLEKFLDYISTRGFYLLEDIVVALLIVFIGFKLTNWVTNLSEKAMVKAKVDQTLRSFLHSIMTYAFKGIIIFSALTKIGFPAGSLVAILGTVGAAVALGLKDSLSSFASGVLILLTKPFAVGEYIEAAGKEGTVKEIQIMNTVLTTVDNKQILIPNNQMAGAVITNYSKEEIRRVDIDFKISYTSDVELAKNLISKTIANHSKVLSNPEVFVRVTDYGANAITITAKAWTMSENYWDVKFDLLETVKKEFDANNIVMPFQRVDINVKNK